MLKLKESHQKKKTSDQKGPPTLKFHSLSPHLTEEKVTKIGSEVQQLRGKSWLCRSRGSPWVTGDFLDDSFSAPPLSSPVTGSSLPLPATPATSGQVSLMGSAFGFRPFFLSFPSRPRFSSHRMGLVPCPHDAFQGLKTVFIFTPWPPPTPSSLRAKDPSQLLKFTDSCDVRFQAQRGEATCPRLHSQEPNLWLSRSFCGSGLPAPLRFSALSPRSHLPGLR